MNSDFKKSTKNIFIEEFWCSTGHDTNRYSSFILCTVDRGGEFFFRGQPHLLKHITESFHPSPPVLLSGYDLPSQEELRRWLPTNPNIGNPGGKSSLYMRGVMFDLEKYGLETFLAWFHIYTICKKHIDGEESYLKEDSYNVFLMKSISTPNYNNEVTNVFFIVYKGQMGWEYSIKFHTYDFFGGSRIFLYSESRYALDYKR